MAHQVQIYLVRLVHELQGSKEQVLHVMVFFSWSGRFDGTERFNLRFNLIINAMYLLGYPKNRGDDIWIVSEFLHTNLQKNTQDSTTKFWDRWITDSYDFKTFLNRCHQYITTSDEQYEHTWTWSISIEYISCMPPEWREPRYFHSNESSSRNTWAILI